MWFSTGRNRICEVQSESTTLPRNKIGLEEALEACNICLVSKKYIGMLNAPAKFDYFLAPFVMLMHIPHLSKSALLCWHEFQAPDECSDVIALVFVRRNGRQDKSTHQH